MRREREPSKTRTTAWSVLGIGLLPLVIAMALGFSIAPPPSVPSGRGTPLLTSAWGPDRTFIAWVTGPSYGLRTTPPGTDSFPYQVALYGGGGNPNPTIRDSPSTDPNVERRDLVVARGTVVEVVTYRTPQPEPGTQGAYRKATWVEQGRAVAVAYAYELRPETELVALVEGLRSVTPAVFASQLRDDPRPDHQPPAPRLVGATTTIESYHPQWVRETADHHRIDVRVADLPDTAASAFAGLAADPRARPVTVRGHPALVIADPDNPAFGQLVWVEQGALVRIDTETANPPIAAADALTVPDAERWTQLALANLLAA